MHVQTSLDCKVDIGPLLKYERQTVTVKDVIDEFNSVNAIVLVQHDGIVLNFHNPFDAKKIAFVLRKHPLEVWKKDSVGNRDETFAHPGDLLLAPQYRLETPYYRSPSSNLHVHHTHASEDETCGGYVYVIDGLSGKYLCTLDYLYCLYNSVDVTNRNPWSVSNATGVRPKSAAICNGLYWQRICTDGMAGMRDDLYYSKDVGAAVAAGKTVLYGDLNSYREHEVGYGFGLALAYVIDEALDKLKYTKHRINDEPHYAKMFGDLDTSRRAHDILWMATNAMREVRAVQTAVCVLFGREVYSRMMLSMNTEGVPVGNAYNTLADAYIDAEPYFVKYDFDKQDAYARTYPFANLVLAQVLFNLG